jgi:hypothetical protein
MPDLTITVPLDDLTYSAVLDRATAQGVTPEARAITAVLEMAKADRADLERTMLSSIQAVWPKFTDVEMARTIATFKAARER